MTFTWLFVIWSLISTLIFGSWVLFSRLTKPGIETEKELARLKEAQEKQKEKSIIQHMVRNGQLTFAGHLCPNCGKGKCGCRLRHEILPPELAKYDPSICIECCTNIVPNEEPYCNSCYDKLHKEGFFS